VCVIVAALVSAQGAPSSLEHRDGEAGRRMRPASPFPVRTCFQAGRGAPVRRTANAAPAIVSSTAPASNDSSVDGRWRSKPPPLDAVGVAA